MKAKLAKEARRSEPVPVWVVQKTNGRVRRTRRGRSWRRSASLSL
ncbi:MAG: 50S ribosomal protein L39e [TACK group archaeon]|nr:50S ribosomal protein L39e [TACK group archaeon]